MLFCAFAATESNTLQYSGSRVYGSVSSYACLCEKYGREMIACVDVGGGGGGGYVGGVWRVGGVWLKVWGDLGGWRYRF